MRRTQFVAALLVCAAVGLPRAALAQNAPPLTILIVTMDAAGDQVTITGKGFGPAPLVTIDGQPVTVLLGSTDTQVIVIAPSVLVTTPGTYRLTLVDSVRKVGEVFVVASRAGLVPGVSLTTSGTSPTPSGAGVATAQPRANSVSVGNAIEDPGSPYTTALGYQSAANTTGLYNTATGYKALYFNAAGYDNTASGVYALYSNTTGYLNTASGVDALSENTTGSNNTASGFAALTSNTTGSNNTALGTNAGYSATTGSNNVFLGANVFGTATDMNTIRLGLPYNGAIGQNQTFIAGIYGTPITGGVPVVIDANGQLGTVNPQSGSGLPVPLSSIASSPAPNSAVNSATTIVQLQQQVRDQQTTNAELRATIADQGARLARLEALVGSSAGRK
jgi:hypothetical protein